MFNTKELNENANITNKLSDDFLNVIKDVAKENGSNEYLINIIASAFYCTIDNVDDIVPGFRAHILYLLSRDKDDLLEKYQSYLKDRNKLN